MNTDIALTDKEGKYIKVKVPEPEYIEDFSEIKAEGSPERSL